MAGSGSQHIEKFSSICSGFLRNDNLEFRLIGEIAFASVLLLELHFLFCFPHNKHFLSQVNKS